jgi:hypothetical protein
MERFISPSSEVGRLSDETSEVYISSTLVIPLALSLWNYGRKYALAF